MRATSLIIVFLVSLFTAGPALSMDVNIKVSSFKMDLGLAYAPENLMDGDPTTAWAGGSISSGEGQWMEFAFGVPVRVTRLGIFQRASGRGPV